MGIFSVDLETTITTNMEKSLPYGQIIAPFLEGNVNEQIDLRILSIKKFGNFIHSSF